MRIFGGKKTGRIGLNMEKSLPIYAEELDDESEKESREGYGSLKYRPPLTIFLVGSSYQKLSSLQKAHSRKYRSPACRTFDCSLPQPRHCSSVLDEADIGREL